jgi:small subunit ribosomal protein S4
MTKRAEAKYKIDRRMGENIWGRPKSPVNKREYGPGQHGQRRKGKATDFGTQLKAKQKVKGYYGNISERQFHKYYQEALRLKGDSSANLIGLLERRLDAVVYRAKFVATVFAARQFVNHGHVKVNGRRVNIPSYQVRSPTSSKSRNPRASSPSCWRRPRSPSATSPTSSRSTMPG